MYFFDMDTCSDYMVRDGEKRGYKIGGTIIIRSLVLGEKKERMTEGKESKEK